LGLGHIVCQGTSGQALVVETNAFVAVGCKLMTVSQFEKARLSSTYVDHDEDRCVVRAIAVS
jgi:hypothetical protein